MKIEQITIQPDASAWTAVVSVAGVLFRAGYVAGRLSCSRVAYKFPPRTPLWALSSVEKWAREQVAALPAAWHSEHQAMYSIAA